MPQISSAAFITGWYFRHWEMLSLKWAGSGCSFASTSYGPCISQLSWSWGFSHLCSFSANFLRVESISLMLAATFILYRSRQQGLGLHYLVCTLTVLSLHVSLVSVGKISFFSWPTSWAETFCFFSFSYQGLYPSMLGVPKHKKTFSKLPSSWLSCPRVTAETPSTSSTNCLYFFCLPRPSTSFPSFAPVDFWEKNKVIGIYVLANSFA